MDMLLLGSVHVDHLHIISLCKPRHDAWGFTSTGEGPGKGRGYLEHVPWGPWFYIPLEGCSVHTLVLIYCLAMVQLFNW